MQKLIHYRCEICEIDYASEDEAIKCEEKHALTEKLIKEFIDKVKNKYPSIKISYKYSKSEDMHWIYHSSFVKHDDFDFICFTGGLLRQIFYNNDIWNTCFCYDYDFNLT